MNDSSGIVRCAASECMKPVSIVMQFPADPLRYPYPYCVQHAVIVARVFDAEEATDGEDEDAK